MKSPHPNLSGGRLAVPGATVARAARAPAALVALALPLVAPAVQAASCDNQALPGAAACVSTIAAGQTVTGTTINNGGSQTVRGSAVASTVSSGGTQTISSGGAASNTLLAGGRQIVSRGGLASGTTVGNDGLLTVFSAGSTVSTVVSSGGTQYVSAGGTATGTTVVSGGSFGVSRGGIGIDSVVSSGGLMRVYSGGLVSSSLVAGGKQYVSAGGSAVGTVVSAGSQVVFTGGATTATVVNGGIQLVSSGGLAQGTQVNAGGAQTVLLGGSAAQSTVAAGGTLTVDVGGTTAAGPVAAQTLAGVALAGTLTIDEAAADALTGNAALSVDQLAMQGGTVQFAAPRTGGFKTVTVTQLSGSGQFVLNTNVGAGQADRLVVEQGTGAYTLSVHDASTTAAAAGTRLELVQAAGTGATFSLAGSNGIDVGAYKFALQNDNGDYFLANTGQTSDIASVAQAAAATASLLWYQQLETAFSYLGDLRNGADGGGQLWVRAYDQRMKTSPGGTATELTLYGAQIGRDWSIATHAGTLHVGATGGYAEANESFDGIGNGTARPWNIGAYAGFDTPSGLFADTVVRYLGFKQSLGVSTAGNQASGDYAQSGFAVSLDAGKRWQLGQRWWAEPRLEVTWQHAGAIAYESSLGTPVMLQSKSLVFGGAGARVGTSLAVGDLKLDPYVGVEAMHVFNAGLGDTIGGTALNTTLPKTWVNADLGVGASLTRHVRAWGAFGYGKGHDYSQPWAVTVGISYVD
ncbi:autotransporter outer membrane beta-barrel domain-containing protein [Burkholderia perseverans]|uniref:autotransporter outer membrane beta-barrel domain-containing protein n=1 Tax=Burkholderia perseverans TaxID=2615214 RepID=UPI001FEE75F9|nr:autotransporter outer membrane beta-barrel domain-containing protein [Burkholderia perseverans]